MTNSRHFRTWEFVIEFHPAIFKMARRNLREPFISFRRVISHFRRSSIHLLMYLHQHYHIHHSPQKLLSTATTTMGGDDLASDDEYLFDNNLKSGGRGRGTDDVSSDDEAGSTSDGDDGISHPSLASKKRPGTDEQNSVLVSSSKKRKKNNVSASSKDILLHVGRGIAMDTVNAQAIFLGTLFSHSMKMSEGVDSGEGDINKEKNDSFQFLSHLYEAPKETNEETRQFQHSNLAAFLRSGPLPSNKRLKNWKHPHSPMILIVTLSARRSVELMKQLSSLKLPIAKLFAKHMSVEEQVELLRGLGNSSSGSSGGKKKGSGKCYSLAVGTPGRLLKLLKHGNDGEIDPRLEQGALRLNHTELVVIDCHEDSKGWNVCTLKDTSTELMDLMKDGVIPQLEKRKGKIKLSLF
jgi:hypothetical protein